MKFIQLKTEITKKVLPVYKIIGDDGYLKQEALKMLERNIVKSNADFNVNYFSTENISVSDVLKACNTLPFFAEHRVVVIKDYDSKKNEELSKALLEYLKQPNPSTVLILFDNFDIIFKNLNNLEVIDCNRLPTDILIKKIISEFNKNNKNIDSKTATKLIEYTNSDLNLIMMEINKLSNYLFDKNYISLKDIEDLVNVSVEFKIFELSNAVGNKQVDKAIEIIDILLQDTRNIGMIISLIYTHFRRLFFVSVSKESVDALSQQLGIKEFAINKLKTQTKLYSQVKLLNILKIIENVDYKIKSGEMSGVNAVYYMVYNIV